MIKFDFDADLRFRDSLTSLGARQSVDILDSLAAISAQGHSWDEFAYRYGWEPLCLPGIDTFPAQTNYTNSRFKPPQRSNTK